MVTTGKHEIITKRQIVAPFIVKKSGANAYFRVWS